MEGKIIEVDKDNGNSCPFNDLDLCLRLKHAYCCGATIPDECPLKEGPVTVRFKEKSRCPDVVDPSRDPHRKASPEAEGW